MNELRHDDLDQIIEEEKKTFQVLLQGQRELLSVAMPKIYELADLAWMRTPWNINYSADGKIPINITDSQVMHQLSDAEHQMSFVDMEPYAMGHGEFIGSICGTPGLVNGKSLNNFGYVSVRMPGTPFYAYEWKATTTHEDMGFAITIHRVRLLTAPGVVSGNVGRPDVGRKSAATLTKVRLEQGEQITFEQSTTVGGLLLPIQEKVIVSV